MCGYECVCEHSSVATLYMRMYAMYILEIHGRSNLLIPFVSAEGQRKAEYEEFDAEKKRITNQIRNMKKEIREMSSAKPSKVN